MPVIFLINPFSCRVYNPLTSRVAHLFNDVSTYTSINCPGWNSALALCLSSEKGEIKATITNISKSTNIFATSATLLAFSCLSLLVNPKSLLRPSRI